MENEKGKTVEAASDSNDGLGDLGRALVNATREKRGEKPIFLCQLEVDPRDQSAIIQALTEERDQARLDASKFYIALQKAWNAMSERRGYAEAWEWKYGAAWDEEDADVSEALHSA